MLALFISLASAQTVSNCVWNNPGLGAPFDNASCMGVCQVPATGHVDCDFNGAGLFLNGVDATAVETSAHNGFDFSVYGTDLVNNTTACCLITEGQNPVEVLNLFGTDQSDLLGFTDGALGLDLGSSTATLRASILGGRSGDTIEGSRRLDVIESLAGGRGNDFIHGHQGNDKLFGGDGRDDLLGGSGDDRICGSDTCRTDDGVGDFMHGGANDDVLCDADTLGATHTMDGDTGVDTLWLEPASGPGGGAGGGFGAGSQCEPGGAPTPESVGGAGVPGSAALAAGNCASGTPATTAPAACSIGGVPDPCVPPFSIGSACN